MDACAESSVSIRETLKSDHPRGFMIKFPDHFSIGTVRIAPATVLAPMAGVTDTVFRRFIRNLGGCGLIMTEFTSSHGVSASLGARKPTRTLQYLAFEPEEHPISAQLVRRRPGRHGGCRARLPGPGLRHPRHQFRLPGQQGGEVQRRVRPAARPAAGGAPAARSAASDHDSVHPEIPRRLERPRTGDRAHGAAGGGLRPAGHRAASAHARAGLQRQGRLEPHRGSEGRGEDSGDRQRRHRHARRTPSAWCAKPAATR